MSGPVAVGVALVLAAAAALVPGRVARADAPVLQPKPRGMTVSCFRWGPGEWDGPQMPATVDRLASLGVNWIAIHPYASVADDGGLRRTGFPASAVTVPTRLARERGMQMFVKPHLGYWRSRFTWRGEIGWDDAATEQRFLDAYRAWILEQAELAEAAGAACFAVGTELRKLVHHEAWWRETIRQVRERFSGPLTYAANFDEYTLVPFWDALDLIGVQWYFPLIETPDPEAHRPERPPTDAELHRGWTRNLATLRAFAEAQGRPVLLTEFGHSATPLAAAAPWLTGESGPDPAAALALKTRLMRIGLDRLAGVEGEPWFAGVFLWKWFPSPDDIAGEFVLQYPAMEQVLRARWGGAAAD